MMIPGRLVADSLGLCDGSPRWWELWTDIITRAPAHDDELDEYDVVARSRNVPSAQVYAAFAPFWSRHVEGYEGEQPAPVRQGSEGPLIRYPYDGRGTRAPVPSDDCSVEQAVLDGRYGVYMSYRCNGACASYTRENDER